MSNDKINIEPKERIVREPEQIDYDESNNVAEIHEQIQREEADPSQGAEAIPLWGLAFIGFILASGFMYFGMYSGGFSGDVYDERAGAAMGATGSDSKGEEEDPLQIALKAGSRVYKANCQACHQASGAGVAGQYPPLAGSSWVLENDERLIALILGGLQGPIEVKGVIYNNVMVGWGSTLDDKKIAAVLTYIRLKEEWGNAGEPIGDELVAKVRSEHGDRSEAWTADELINVFGK